MKKVKEYLILFLTMLKIGAFTFGGGYAMIPLLKREFVEKKKWITDEELINMITISESTPGPIAINMATFIGYRLHKILGAIVSTVGMVIPSFLVIVIIMTFLNNIMEYELVRHAFVGINCAVGVLISLSFFSLLKTMKKDVFSIVVFILSIIATFIILYFSLNFSTVYLIIIGAILSLIYYDIKTNIKKRKMKQ